MEIVQSMVDQQVEVKMRVERLELPDQNAQKETIDDTCKETVDG